MNIAIILKHVLDPEAGGVQRVTYHVSRIFTQFKHRVIVISFTTEEKVILLNDVQVIKVNNKQQLKKLLDDHSIDLLINQEGYSLKFTRMLLSITAPSIYVINNLHINPLNFSKNYKEFIAVFLSKYKLKFLNFPAFQKAILYYHIVKQRYELNYIVKNTCAFVMLSELFKAELYQLVPLVKRYDHKIYGINNPFERPQLDMSTFNKENVILFVGRLNILQKGVDRLLYIWKQLHQQLPNWMFWVVGEGEDELFMKDFCHKNEMNRVTFFGKNDPSAFYKRAKIFHMTSAFEGFGNVLIEAQSYGCVPMLFNSYAAAADIVKHNENGILVTPFNIDEYVKETLELINNQSKWQKMSISSYENVTRFSYEATYEKWNSVFNKIESFI